MQGRPPRLNACSTTPALSTRSARCTKARQPPTGWSRSASAASLSPRRLSPASGQDRPRLTKRIILRNIRFNIIDTPGHIDFTVEVKRSLRVLDGAVVVFDGVAGVEPQSETNWRYADEALCHASASSTSSTALVQVLKVIRLDPRSPQLRRAVRMQIPIGAEGDFEGVIDLLKMKAYKFEGEMG
jgi:translation elongation factor EF-G